MKDMDDNKKINKSMTDILHKASDIGKKVAGNVQEGAKALSEKSKNDSYMRRMKKYNPLFPEKYHSEDFKIPNMIMIVDDAVRRGIDVCEGAIGWIGNETGMEILFLYDEYIEQSGINFIPVATCDAIYYVDSFDRNRFVRTDCIFTKAHEEKLAELEHIAYALGAKSCSIEIAETNVDVESNRKNSFSKLNYKGISAGESYEKSNQHKKLNSRSGKITAIFEGDNSPRCPELKWFAKDDNIKGLIEMRCSGNNSIKSKVLELSGSSHSTMSQKTACAIDGAIKKIGSKSGVNMEKQATKENSSKLIFEVEF